MTTAGAERALRTWTLPLEAYPALGAFARDLVLRRGRARELAGVMELDPPVPKSRPRQRDELSRALARTNRAWGNSVDGILSRWEAGETVTLMAGQQVGLGGGPLYTLAKIASLIATRRKLEAQGIAATVLFWLATEDHDFAEVASLDVASNEGVERLRMQAPAGRRRPVGSLEIPDRLRRELCRALGLEREPAWLRETITFRDSFAELVAIAVPGEIVLVDSLLPELRAAGRDVLRGLAVSLDEMERVIAARSAELAASGYQPQVLPGEDGHYGLLFLIDERGDRQPVRRAGGSWTAGGSQVDLERVIADEPARVSTGALARPLLQDAVFAPDLFVGGPAEVAYYAQLGDLHQRCGLRRPGIALRGHALVIPSRLLRALERHGVRPDEVFDPPDAIILRRERDDAGRIDAVAAHVEADLARGLEEMKALVLAGDPALEKSLDRTARRVHYHLTLLGERGRRALARRDRERHKAIERASRVLMPGGVAQDRSIGWIGYWMAYGPRLVNRLVEEIDPEANELKIIGV